MDLTYMDHLLTRRLVNFPRVMLRHMAYVISVPQHELPYGDLLTRVFEAYHVPLNDKDGEEPKKRRDNENEEVNNENASAENVEMNLEEGFEWEAVDEEAELQWEHTEKQTEKDADLGSGDQLYDAIDDVRSADEETVAPTALGLNDPDSAAPMTTPAVPTTFPASPADSITVQN
ncbi:hypothetical protein Dimus_015990 [Dionaea muscipula]